MIARARTWFRIRFYCGTHAGTCSLCEAWKAQRKRARGL